MQAELTQSRNFVRRQISELPAVYKKLKAEKEYPVIKSAQLKKLTRQLSKKLQENGF